MAVAHKFSEKLRTDDVLISESVDFNGLMLSESVLHGLVNSGFEKPSPIQLKAIPLGRCGLDLIVQAKSGTGKTCVFSVIALESIEVSAASTQVLVLAPTREIAIQIWQVMGSLGSAMSGLQCHTFIGGLPLHEDRKKLQRCHIAVGTPGRIQHLIEVGCLKTESIRLFVLDEADKLLEEGFEKGINWIYSSLPDNKQMLALSATYPESMAQQLTVYMRNPTFIRLNITDPTLLGIKQHFMSVSSHPLPHRQFEAKTEAVVKILSSVSFHQCLIFSNMQTRAQNLENELTSRGWPTTCIAGCLNQTDRNTAMAKLKSYQCRILISTDLTSRGIDAERVNLVINLDIPKDHETYLHRIGRAGRFGSYGAGVSIVAEGKEMLDLQNIERKISTHILPLPDSIPSDLATRQLPVNLDDVVSTEQLVSSPTALKPPPNPSTAVKPAPKPSTPRAAEPNHDGSTVEDLCPGSVPPKENSPVQESTKSEEPLCGSTDSKDIFLDSVSSLTDEQSLPDCESSEFVDTVPLSKLAEDTMPSSESAKAKDTTPGSEAAKAEDIILSSESVTAEDTMPCSDLPTKVVSNSSSPKSKENLHESESVQHKETSPFSVSIKSDEPLPSCEFSKSERTMPVLDSPVLNSNFEEGSESLKLSVSNQTASSPGNGENHPLSSTQEHQTVKLECQGNLTAKYHKNNLQGMEIDSSEQKSTLISSEAGGEEEISSIQKHSDTGSLKESINNVEKLSLALPEKKECQGKDAEMHTPMHFVTTDNKDQGGDAEKKISLSSEHKDEKQQTNIVEKHTSIQSESRIGDGKVQANDPSELVCSLSEDNELLVSESTETASTDSSIEAESSESLKCDGIVNKMQDGMPLQIPADNKDTTTDSLPLYANANSVNVEEATESKEREGIENDQRANNVKVDTPSEAATDGGSRSKDQTGSNKCPNKSESSFEIDKIQNASTGKPQDQTEKKEPRKNYRKSHAAANMWSSMLSGELFQDPRSPSTSASPSSLSSESSKGDPEDCKEISEKKGKNMKRKTLPWEIELEMYVEARLKAEQEEVKEEEEENTVVDEAIASRPKSRARRRLGADTKKAKPAEYEEIQAEKLEKASEMASASSHISEPSELKEMLPPETLPSCEKSDKLEVKKEMTNGREEKNEKVDDCEVTREQVQGCLNEVLSKTTIAASSTVEGRLEDVKQSALTCQETKSLSGDSGDASITESLDGSSKLVPPNILSTSFGAGQNARVVSYSSAAHDLKQYLQLNISPTLLTPEQIVQQTFKAPKQADEKELQKIPDFLNKLHAQIKAKTLVFPEVKSDANLTTSPGDTKRASSEKIHSSEKVHSSKKVHSSGKVHSSEKVHSNDNVSEGKSALASKSRAAPEEKENVKPGQGLARKSRQRTMRYNRMCVCTPATQAQFGFMESDNNSGSAEDPTESGWGRWDLKERKTGVWEKGDKKANTHLQQKKDTTKAGLTKPETATVNEHSKKESALKSHSTNVFNTRNTTTVNKGKGLDTGCQKPSSQTEVKEMKTKTKQAVQRQDGDMPLVEQGKGAIPKKDRKVNLIKESLKDFTEDSSSSSCSCTSEDEASAAAEKKTMCFQNFYADDRKSKGPKKKLSPKVRIRRKEQEEKKKKLITQTDHVSLPTEKVRKNTWIYPSNDIVHDSSDQTPPDDDAEQEGRASYGWGEPSAQLQSHHWNSHPGNEYYYMPPGSNWETAGLFGVNLNNNYHQTNNQAPAARYDTGNDYVANTNQHGPASWHTQQNYYPGYTNHQPSPWQNLQSSYPGNTNHQPTPWYNLQNNYPGYTNNQPTPGHNLQSNYPGYTNHQPTPWQNSYPGYNQQVPSPWQNQQNNYSGYNHLQQPSPWHNPQNRTPLVGNFQHPGHTNQAHYQPWSQDQRRSSHYSSSSQAQPANPLASISCLLSPLPEVNGYARQQKPPPPHNIPYPPNPWPQHSGSVAAGGYGNESWYPTPWGSSVPDSDPRLQSRRNSPASPEDWAQVQSQKAHRMHRYIREMARFYANFASQES